MKEKGENIGKKAGWDEGDERKTRDAELLNKGRHAATATPALMAGESMLDEPYYVAKTVSDGRATHNKMSKHGVEVRIHIARGVTVQTSSRNTRRHSGAARTRQQMCVTLLWWTDNILPGSGHRQQCVGPCHTMAVQGPKQRETDP